MHLSYLDLLLGFLGLTFGLPSALPSLFFQSKVTPGQEGQAGQTELLQADLRAALRSLRESS